MGYLFVLITSRWGLNISGRTPSDYDDNFDEVGGGVDRLDLAVWESQYGTTGGGLPINGDNADGDSDDDVNGLDFLLWQRQFGLTPPPLAAAATVPELSSVLLALIVLMTGCCGCARFHAHSSY